MCVLAGKRKSVREEGERAPVELFHLRSNGSSIATRCVQIKPDASVLNSEFNYILRVPFDGAEESGIVYVWVGYKAHPEEARLAEEIADDMYGATHTIQIINEGEEPENFFWIGIGGKRKYDRVRHCRHSQASAAYSSEKKIDNFQRMLCQLQHAHALCCRWLTTCATPASSAVPTKRDTLPCRKSAQTSVRYTGCSLE